MSNEAIKELQPIFEALRKTKKILGEEMYDKILRKLISGAMAEGERNFLQNQRRNAVAKSLGMTRDGYERFLEGGKVKRIKEKRKREGFKKIIKIIKNKI